MINELLQRHERFLQQLVKQSYIPADRIRSAMHYSLFPGGKRIRPLLVYLTGELLDLRLEVLDVISAAIELTHCYSLVHDDLPAMDNDDLRRGKPSCHKAYDEATAILVGDGLQALAIEILLKELPALVNPTQVIAITQELVQASGVSGMVSGQSLDLSELAKPNLSEDELSTIHQLKTGKLISACIEMVLAAQSNRSEQQVKALQSFAAHLGLVFQMQDDYLDQYANGDALGKGRASDAANDKTTFARLMSKDDLMAEINRHYQLASEPLELFGDKARVLLTLVEQLHARNR